MTRLLLVVLLAADLVCLRAYAAPDELVVTGARLNEMQPEKSKAGLDHQETPLSFLLENFRLYVLNSLQDVPASLEVKAATIRQDLEKHMGEELTDQELEEVSSFYRQDVYRAFAAKYDANYQSELFYWTLRLERHDLKVKLASDLETFQYLRGTLIDVYAGLYIYARDLRFFLADIDHGLKTYMDFARSPDDPKLDSMKTASVRRDKILLSQFVGEVIGLGIPQLVRNYFNVSDIYKAPFVRDYGDPKSRVPTPELIKLISYKFLPDSPGGKLRTALERLQAIYSDFGKRAGNMLLIFNNGIFSPTSDKTLAVGLPKEVHKLNSLLLLNIKMDELVGLSLKTRRSNCGLLEAL